MEKPSNPRKSPTRNPEDPRKKTATIGAAIASEVAPVV